MLQDGIEHGRKLIGQRKRYGMYPVTIAVQQISGRNLQPPDLDRLSEFNNVRVSMRHADSAGETLIGHCPDGGEIPNGAVCNITGATESLADSRVNFAEQSPDPRDSVGIFHDNN